MADADALVPALDAPYLRVPAEELSIACRAHHKAVEKDVGAVLEAVQGLAPEDGARSVSAEEARERLRALLGDIRGIKRKVEQLREEEDEHVRRCRLRLERLGGAGGSEEGGEVAGKGAGEIPGALAPGMPTTTLAEHRTERLVWDYLRRTGRRGRVPRRERAARGPRR